MSVAQKAVPEPRLDETSAAVESAIARVSEVVVGKEHVIRLAMACLLARGHLLIEDLPGVGKTTLSQALGAALGLEAGRVQFTSDLLPADVLGVSVFDRNSGEFQFHKGPIFTQLLLADEVNRATPKTQSALLEAMEERQVTIEGTTRALPQPFFVIATQNPARQVGTFPLPESQLDRFLIRVEVGYPDAIRTRPAEGCRPPGSRLSRTGDDPEDVVGRAGCCAFRARVGRVGRLLARSAGTYP